MTDPGSPTVRRRRLAAELRRLRERSRRTADQVAKELGWSPSKISRIEQARTGPKLPDVESLLRLYGIEGTHRDELLALAREAERKGWWEAYSDALPPRYGAYIGMEAEAESIWEWQPHVVPGLLQTEDYARQVIRLAQSTATVPPREIERRVETRLARQQVLNRDPPLTLSVVLDESVLLRRFGDNSVMRGQFDRLVEAAQLPNVTLQVLRLDGSHPVITQNFVLLQFPRVHEIVLHDIVHIEHMDAVLYVEEEVATYRYRLAFERLVAAALTSAESLELISKVARGV
ncbi:MAG: helix-turn-helix domain-containing protein [Streptosporangiales bacterium]|nr:helix-turn-helix domain-containing protein [Streptosporangiales bacterium]